MARAPRPPRWSDATARRLLGMVRTRLGVGGTAADGGPLRTDLVDAARWHRVAGAVHAILAEEPGDPDAAATDDPDASATVRRVLGDHVRGLRARHAAVLATLGAIGPQLDDVGRWAVLKGPVLRAQQVRVGPREVGDLDLLVDPEDLPGHLDRLGAAGWAPEERNWRLLARHPIGQLHLRPVDGATRRIAPELDLHWDLVHDPAVRRHLGVPTRELLGAVRPVRLGEVVVPTLAPEDVAVHVALHATLGGGHHLGWYVDLHCAMEAAAIEVHDLLERAAVLGVRLPVAVAARRRVALFGGPGDDDTTADDGGWVRWLERLAPPHDLVRHPGRPAAVVGRGAIAATRSDPAGTAAAILGRAATAPRAALVVLLRAPGLRRLRPLTRHLGRWFPGRALGLERGAPSEFRPTAPTGTGRSTRR